MFVCTVCSGNRTRLSALYGTNYTVEILHDVILAVLLPPFCCEILSCKLYLDCLLSACCRSLELKKGQRDVIFAGEGLLGLTNLIHVALCKST